jgi:citrate synthase
MRLIPRISSLVVDSWRIQQGLELLPPKVDLPTAANFLYQLKGELPDVWEAKMFDAILVLYAEHEFNASTFSARVTASTMADVYAAITTALGTLKGPLHGGANEETMKMLQAIGTPDRAESWLMERLARKEKIMGFGHRVYKSGDSRVPMMREMARDLGRKFGKEAWAEICEKLEAVMDREKHLCANLDLYAAPVFLLLGIPPELNTPIFAVSRISGWCAHVMEQHDRNRLIRPRSIYTGKAERRYQSKRDA